MDSDGYPTDEDVERVKDWPGEDFTGLMAELESGELWHMPDWGIHRERNLWYVSTGGWSGNEEIIAAMQQNRNHWWMFHWLSTRRGGHYRFCNIKSPPADLYDDIVTHIPWAYPHMLADEILDLHSMLEGNDMALAMQPALVTVNGIKARISIEVGDLESSHT